MNFLYFNIHGYTDKKFRFRKMNIMSFFQKIVWLVLIAPLIIFGWRWFGASTRSKSPRFQDESVLRVGTAAEFPPFEFIQDDTIVGFDIDLINAVAERLGKKVILNDMPFLTLIPQAQRGSLQVIGAGLTPTPEREREINFSEPYLESDALVVVSLASNKPLTSLDDLQGKTVIVNEGFTAERFMADKEGIDLKRLPTVADAFLSLRSGRAYAFVVAENNVKPFFKQYSPDEFSIYIIPGTNETTAFGISKKYPQLKEQIDAALLELKNQGIIEELKKKWDLV